MRKHIKKIVLILMIFLFVIMAIVASFEYLINHGKFTSYIEHQINKRIDGEIKIGSIFLDSASGIILKPITFQSPADMEYLDFKCQTLSVKYSFWELLKKHIKEIEIVDPEINVNLLSDNKGLLTNPNIPLSTENIKFIKKSLLPQGLFIEDAAINNITIRITTDDYLVTVSRMNVLTQGIQSELPFDVSINCAVSIINRQNNDENPEGVSGEIDIKAICSIVDDEFIRLKSTAAIKDLNVTYEDIVFKVDELEIPVEAEMFPFDPKGKVTCKCQFNIANGQLWAYGTQIANLNFPVVFEMDYPEKMTVFTESVDGDMLLDTQRIPLAELFSNIKINLGLEPLDKMPFNASIDTAISDPIHITGEYEYENAIIMKTKIGINNINFKALAKRFKTLIPDYYKDWSFDGNISVDTFLDAPDHDDPLKISANTTFSFSDVKFSSPDYDYFGENINGIVEIEVDTDWDFMQFHTRTGGDLEPFLIQLGFFTTNMRSRNTTFYFDANFDAEKRVLSDINGALLWKDVGLFTIDGNVANLNNNPAIDLNLKITDLSNSAFFETFVKDTVEYSYPTLFNAHIDGLTNTELHISGTTDNAQIDGRLGVKNTNLQFEDVSVKELSIDFPISIKYPYSKTKTSIQKKDVPDSQYGTIKIGKLMLGALQINNLHFNPAIINNNFFIKERLSVPVFGGSFDINDIFIDDIINADRKINFTFQLNDIDIKQASATYGITPFEGFLNSSEITFKQQGDNLFSEGEMRFNVFGGNIVINNLILSNFMSSLMEIGFSANVNNLDLEQMSNTFKEWGYITGIISGKIDDFKIVAGEPSGFDVELKTEKRKGVKQIVSSTFLKSFVPGVGNILNNLGITTFKYDVIGLNAKLENDYISFKGAVREDGKELFMKGAGMKKLDIVFNNTDKRTKFKTFLGSFESMMDSNFDDTQVNIK
ncbi:MAG: hypothetical protein ACUZ8O_16495 [Candidatus Anammoxibacter sp.]